MTHTCETCVFWTEDRVGAYFGHCERFNRRAACNYGCTSWVARQATPEASQGQLTLQAVRSACCNAYVSGSGVCQKCGRNAP
jgi:hypothetical protein